MPLNLSQTLSCADRTSPATPCLTKPCPVWCRCCAPTQVSRHLSSSNPHSKDPHWHCPTMENRSLLLLDHPRRLSCCVWDKAELGEEPPWPSRKWERRSTWLPLIGGRLQGTEWWRQGEQPSESTGWQEVPAGTTRFQTGFIEIQTSQIGCTHLR